MPLADGDLGALEMVVFGKGLGEVILSYEVMFSDQIDSVGKIPLDLCCLFHAQTSGRLCHQFQICLFPRAELRK